MRIDELVGVKKYKTREMRDVLKDFEAAGGEWLGNGKFATVIGHPRWNYVIKFFPKDGCYVAFVRFAMRNPHPSFPKFLDKPKQIVPFHKRPHTEPFLHIVKMERLRPLNDDKELHDWIKYFLEREAIHHGEKRLEYEDNPRAQETEHRIMAGYKKYPALHSLVEAYSLLLHKFDANCAHDIHSGNIMQRDNGELVLTDPVWEGMSFFQIHDQLMQAEIGYLGDEDEWEDPYKWILGGEKKPPKKPKQKPWVPSTDEEFPF